MKISVWSRSLSNSYLRLMVQLGVDCIDFNQGTDFPGVRERGYPDLEEVKKIKNRIRSFGLEINRVTLPDITDKFMKDGEGGLEELENTCRALKVFGEAGVPLARQRFAGETVEKGIVHYKSSRRGGYLSRGEKIDSSQQQDILTTEDAEDWWRHFRIVFKELVSIAEDYNVKLGIHPSDPPLPQAPLGTIGFGHVIDEFPSKVVGYIYCCGTRGEDGGQELVLDEIRNYGRKGRIFEVHFRNIKGSLTSSGWFEETLLDEGDMSMFKILQSLREVGFEGCLNPDHVPFLEWDGERVCHGLAYSIGFIKAQLEALEAMS